MVNRSSLTPPWEQLAQIIREQIARGDLQPGDRLPSVRHLSQEYDVAPGTVTKALTALKAEGLLASRTGWGTFVRDTQPGS